MKSIAYIYIQNERIYFDKDCHAGICLVFVDAEPLGKRTGLLSIVLRSNSCEMRHQE